MTLRLIPGVQVTKGRLTDAGTGDYREFSLNPNDIEFGHGYTYPSFGIPGGSQPILQAGEGKDRPVQFTLRLDGDVGYRNRRRFQAVDETDVSAEREGLGFGSGNTVASGNRLSLSIQDEINWYVSLTYPGEGARRGNIDAAPPVLLLTLGTMFRGARVVLEDVNVKILKMSPDLEPVRADLLMRFKQAPIGSVGRNTIYDRTNPRRNF